jgi:hypothetical protein
MDMEEIKKGLLIIVAMLSSVLVLVLAIAHKLEVFWWQ